MSQRSRTSPFALRAPHPILRVLRQVLVVGLLLAALGAGRARAAEPAGGDDSQNASDPCLNDTLCRGHYDEARQAYKDKRYEEALKEYRAAYERRQAPWLLINVGRTLQRLGRLDESLDYYQRYLRADPNPKPEVKTRVEGYIDQVKAGIETAPKKEPEPPPTMTAAPAQPAPPPPQPEGKPVYKKWWFWTILGVVVAGGAAAGVAVALTRDNTPAMMPVTMQPMVPAGVTVYEPKF